MSSSPPSPLARLWAHAQHALTALCASLVPLDTFSGGERRRLRGWLRALEAFCRRLALCQAFALMPSLKPAAARAGQKPATQPQRRRRASLRLWSRCKRPQARIRLLGAPTSVREIEAAQRRAALIARLRNGRAQRKSDCVRIAERIEALQLFLAAPAAAVRRFAHKLKLAPEVAVAVVSRRAPACPYLAPDLADAAQTHAFAAIGGGPSRDKS
ncbi:hypothetical protein [Terricaulis sp.]|uniref:hypothetical protein n=1 Tax=Terricaulis sp. TaxID=2768686 RepID=UPI0037839F14